MCHCNARIPFMVTLLFRHSSCVILDHYAVSTCICICICICGVIHISFITVYKKSSDLMQEVYIERKTRQYNVLLINI